MNANEVKTKQCACAGQCTGYGTRSDCPPLIVLAVALVAKTPSDS